MIIGAIWRNDKMYICRVHLRKYLHANKCATLRGQTSSKDVLPQAKMRKKSNVKQWNRSPYKWSGSLWATGWSISPSTALRPVSSTVGLWMALVALIAARFQYQLHLYGAIITLFERKSNMQMRRCIPWVTAIERPFSIVLRVNLAWNTFNREANLRRATQSRCNRGELLYYKFCTYHNH